MNFGPNVIYFVLGTLLIAARLTYSLTKTLLIVARLTKTLLLLRDCRDTDICTGIFTDVLTDVFDDRFWEAVKQIVSPWSLGISFFNS